MHSFKGRESQQCGFLTRLFCESQEDAETAKQILTEWLSKRGLTLSPEKTRIVHLTEGFDFLGFNVRHYAAPQSKSGWKLLIKPSKKAVVKERAKLRETWLRLKGHSLRSVLDRLNPLIRGWANYHCKANASTTFSH